MWLYMKVHMEVQFDYGLYLSKHQLLIQFSYEYEKNTSSLSINLKKMIFYMWIEQISILDVTESME